MTPDSDGVVSNGFISITMPAEAAGTYLAYSYEDDINIYDKESNEAGFGGFTFGVAATEDYSKYSDGSTKIGELTEKDGKLYHIVLSFPTDVQWDITKNDEMPESYGSLYNNAREIASTVASVNGGTYVDGAGTKGEEIYGDLLKEIKGKIESAKDADELKSADLSPVYYELTQGDAPKDPMKTIGYCCADFNLDGVDEMVIGDIESKEVYDIFAAKDGKATHVISGNLKDYYKVYGTVVAEYMSESEGVNIIHTYCLFANSDELLSQYSIKTDETEGVTSRWSISYDNGESWEALTEEDYEQDLSNIESFSSDTPLNFTAIGELN